MGIKCSELSSQSYQLYKEDEEEKEEIEKMQGIEKNRRKNKNKSGTTLLKGSPEYERKQRNQLYAGTFTSDDDFWEKYIPSLQKNCPLDSQTQQITKNKLIGKSQTDHFDIKPSQKQMLQQMSAKKSEADLDLLIQLEKKKTQTQDEGPTMMRVSTANYNRLSVNYDNGGQSSELSSEYIGTALKNMSEQLQAYKETLMNIQQILREFSVEQKITSEAFKKITEKYRQKDELFAKKFLPLIIKIHSKIYDRIRKQLNQYLETQISRKIKEHQIELNQEQQQGNLMSKIDALADELAYKDQKIKELETQMDIQIEIVKSTNNKSQIYRAKLSELEADKKRLKNTIHKYSSSLKPFVKKEKRSKIEASNIDALQERGEVGSSSEIES